LRERKRIMSEIKRLRDKGGYLSTSSGLHWTLTILSLLDLKIFFIISLWGFCDTRSLQQDLWLLILLVNLPRL
jgi:hypothetical protein